MDSPPNRSRPLRLRRLRRLRPFVSLPKSRGWRSWRGCVFWRAFCDVRSAPLELGCDGVDSVAVDGTSPDDVATSDDASALNSPRSSSKSSVGVATVRRDRTAREALSVESLDGAG